MIFLLERLIILVLIITFLYYLFKPTKKAPLEKKIESKKKLSKEEYNFLLAEGNNEVLTDLEKEFKKKYLGKDNSFYQALIKNAILSAQKKYKKGGNDLTDNMFDALEKCSEADFLLTKEDIPKDVQKPQEKDPGWHTTRK